MRRGLRRAWLPVVAAWGLLAGCEHNHASHYPPDPLLLSKKPVESRGEPASPPAVACHEPHGAALPPGDPGAAGSTRRRGGAGRLAVGRR